MAQNYEIDIKRFNGQDYDTLLPTPASHASTHQAGGSDPLTLQTGNYGDSSIPTSAYQNSSISRTKLAQDALYSPVVSKSASYSIVTSDLGKTIMINSSSAATITFDSAVAASMPVGAEIAILRFGSGAVEIAFTGTGPNVYHTGDGQIRERTDTTTTTIQIPEQFDMIALKRVYSNSWVITGNVEVVE